MRGKPATLWTAALAAGFALLLGYFALQSEADQPVIHDPYDQANRHSQQVE